MTDNHRACASCLLHQPERLVVQGLRGWLSGYETSDIACWEAVWNDHARDLGADRAKTVVAELAAWVRILRLSGRRSIACYPRPCRLLCRDECVALGLIAGCQTEAWPVATAAAEQLAGAEAADAVLAAGRSYAGALTSAGQRLGPAGLAALAEIAPPRPAALH